MQAAAQHRDWQAQQQQGQGRINPGDADAAALGGLSPKASGSFKVCICDRDKHIAPLWMKMRKSEPDALEGTTLMRWSI